MAEPASQPASRPPPSRDFSFRCNNFPTLSSSAPLAFHPPRRQRYATRTVVVADAFFRVQLTRTTRRRLVAETPLRALPMSFYERKGEEQGE